ncbi:chemokine (C-C motif) ligand 38, duplicate 6 [Plectropomus leopardus]|uniref:chemokine (C-C motif) ligand 38, duplicate 6 n=1 Tax=Plectropomus leopardus TaxID=160734 RepID=UPI001C4CBBEE|nr:chemokine (C-C motif) ligand 38, duplicate 6 [Plectropomus leopardus]
MMMMIKNPVTLLTLALLLSSLTVLAYQGGFGPNECCFDFISTRLRKDRVLNFTYTDKRCSMEGVLFKMMNGAEICADPTAHWVKTLIKAKEKVKTN